MIRIRQVAINVFDDTEESLLNACCKKLRIDKKLINNYSVNKKSIDARKKTDIFYSYEIDLDILNEDKILKKNKSNDIFKTPSEEYKFVVTGTEKLKHRPIIVGFGPCGIFASYFLAKSGFNPIIIERGEEVDERVKSVEEFWKNGKLNISSNVQFGEGGAGTFSDGKLNTLVKDKMFRQKEIFRIFVENGAPKEILYESKPHIGTDILCTVIKNIRKKIIMMGGEFKFNTCLTNIEFSNGKIKSIELNNKEKLETDVLILAIGHSARDTFKMLYDKKLNMTSKSFAIGVRISHPQEMIDKSQYGSNELNISKASYKLTYKANNGRGVYTFCMCPGGYVVNSSSENNLLSINGMSNYNRESDNANSAVIVTVSPNDFGTSAMDGVNFQRVLEQKAFKEGNGLIPIQLYKDLKSNIISNEFGNVKPIFKGNYKFSNIRNILPNYVIDSLIEGIDAFDKKIKGFSRDDAIIAAVESRTSSPIRIVRDENLESNIKGIYPAGEGAGYAGGITSSAVDGIKIFEQIIKKYESMKK